MAGKAANLRWIDGLGCLSWLVFVGKGLPRPSYPSFHLSTITGKATEYYRSELPAS